MRDRKVKRVLIMLEYEPAESEGSEVYDLTALVQDLAAKSPFGICHLDLQVDANRIYNVQNKEYDIELKSSWGGYVCGGQFSGRSSHLEDVLNQTLPDNDRVANLRKRSKRLRKKADEVDYDASIAKLEQVAAVRGQLPIAHVTKNAEMLPQNT